MQIEANLDEMPIYLHFLKYVEISFVAAMDGEFLEPESIQLTADDPTIIEVKPVEATSPDAIGLTLLKPEADKAVLTLKLRGKDDKVVDKKLVLVFAESLGLAEATRTIDFDGFEAVTLNQWNAMSLEQRSAYDMVIDYVHVDVDSISGLFAFPYGHISVPADFFSFATYDLYPESGNLPACDYVSWQAEPFRYSDLFLVESFEGRIYKVLFFGTHLDFIEIKPKAKAIK
jgi:hypothetical protein